MSKIRVVKRRRYPEVLQGGLGGIGSLLNVYKLSYENSEEFRARIKNKIPSSLLSPTLNGIFSACESYRIPLSGVELTEEFPARIKIELLAEAMSNKNLAAIENLILRAKPAGVDFEIFIKLDFAEPQIQLPGESFTAALEPSQFFVIGQSTFDQLKPVKDLDEETYFIIGVSTFNEEKKAK